MRYIELTDYDTTERERISRQIIELQQQINKCQAMYQRHSTNLSFCFHMLQHIRELKKQEQVLQDDLFFLWAKR